ncbi:MAG: hypothetical protein ACK559_29215, partial [bacterium]
CTTETYLFVLDKIPDADFDMAVEQAHDISVPNQIALLQNPAHPAHQHYKFEHGVLYRYVIVPGITNRLDLPVLERKSVVELSSAFWTQGEINCFSCYNVVFIGTRCTVIY